MANILWNNHFLFSFAIAFLVVLIMGLTMRKPLKKRQLMAGNASHSQFLILNSQLTPFGR